MAKGQSKKAKTLQSPSNSILDNLAPTKKLKFIRLPLNLVIFTIAFLTALITSVIALHFMFTDRIYPGISIAQVDVAGLTRQQALEKLNYQLSQRSSQKLSFSYQDSTQHNQLADFISTNLAEDLNYRQVVDQAFQFGHSQFYFQPINLNLSFSQNPDLSSLTTQVNQEPIDSELKVTGTDITTTPSQPGFVLNQLQFEQQLLSYLNSGQISTTNLPMMSVQPHIDYTTASKIKNKLDRVKNQPLTLTYQDSSSSAQKQDFALDFPTLLNLIDLQQDNFLNPDKVSGFLASIAQKVDRDVQEPLFNFDPHSPNRVSEFSPPVIGKKLDQDQTKKLIAQALLDDSFKEINLPVQSINPKNKLTNDMGIKELIGQGKSNFTGSIDNRIYNLKLAASRLNGTLVAPGATFSFLGTLGKINAATGFKQAYVIKSGHTVLDDGGGVCQVSTTLFRAVLNSGMPVIERTAHAYRVGYYEQGGYPPGLDATVYDPGVDFKFKNDTSNYILIQAFATDDGDLAVNFYGTSDGRIAMVSSPVVTNITPPPPDIHQDDPNLPKGVIQQTEHAIPGANVFFSRKVVKNGQTIINESFKSNYVPWQAVYLVGTKEH